MKRRYALAPQAARDLVRIWAMSGDASSSGIGHPQQVRSYSGFSGRGTLAPRSDARAGAFFLVYSYLIVYRPEAKPLQIVAILHASRDVAAVLPPHLFE